MTPLKRIQMRVKRELFKITLQTTLPRIVKIKVHRVLPQQNWSEIKAELQVSLDYICPLD